MKTENKTPVPSAGARTIRLSEIKADDDMRVRSGTLSPQHIKELRQTVNRGSKLPPVLVWEEVKDGEPTGRFTILDGRHRIAALRKEKPKLAEIKAEVFTGSKAEALLMAASRNTKAALPLTTRDRTNAAWAVVRMDREPYGISKSAIVKSCGVSDRTVGTMRAKWKAWPDDLDPSGDWHRDRREGQNGGDDWDAEEAMKQQQEKIDKASIGVLAAIGRLIRTDSVAAWEAIAKALGHRTAEMIDYLGPPEDDPPHTGLEGDPDAIPLPF
jgi:hypothetical protein